MFVFKVLRFLLLIPMIAFLKLSEILASSSVCISTIELMLSSSIDSVRGDTGRFLTSSLVGHIPVTGQIMSR